MPRLLSPNSSALNVVVIIAELMSVLETCLARQYRSRGAGLFIVCYERNGQILFVEVCQTFLCRVIGVIGL